MLNEERRTIILQIVERDGSASVQDLMLLLDASESTIRRDLTELDKRHLLVKVYGGAIANQEQGKIITADVGVKEREVLNRESKLAIAKKAAELVNDDDVVFLDAGTTTGFMIDFLAESEATFVTNAINHAAGLCRIGRKVIMPGGVLKNSTEALTGAQTCKSLEQFHFTKGFFGTNGITRQEGCTTPDAEEAAVKKMAAKHCREGYVLADGSKFGQISTVTFAGFGNMKFVTDQTIPADYAEDENIVIVE